MAINVYRCKNLAYWPRYVFLDSLREKGIPYTVEWDKKKKEYLFRVDRTVNQGGANAKDRTNQGDQEAHGQEWTNI